MNSIKNIDLKKKVSVTHHLSSFEHGFLGGIEESRETNSSASRNFIYPKNPKSGKKCSRISGYLDFRRNPTLFQSLQSSQSVPWQSFRLVIFHFGKMVWFLIAALFFQFFLTIYEMVSRPRQIADVVR